jgi:type II secretory pathway pseudopilin PulG
MRIPAALRNLKGFTLIEIFAVIVLIMILVALLVPAYEQVRMRTDKVNCINNLRQLHVGASAYVQEYGSWPQVNPMLAQPGSTAYEEVWIEDFLPFGVGRGTWICPTMERELGGPDYTQPANYRADYYAMPFDTKHITPFRQPTFPWFVERGNVHGNGNLVMQSNGAVRELDQMVLASGTYQMVSGPGDN